MILQTETNDVPLAVLGFQGRLIAGVGKALRLYDMGKKKLLRKVENKVHSSLSYPKTRITHRFLVIDVLFRDCHTSDSRVQDNRW